MKQFTFLLAVLCFGRFIGFAQQSSTGEKATYMYAKTSAMFSQSSTYKVDHKYTVVNIYKKGDTQNNGYDWTELKKRLQKKNVETVDLYWSTEEELKAAFAKYKFDIQVSYDNGISIRSKNVSCQVADNNIVILFEEASPKSILLGDTQKQLQYFFKLISFD